MDLRHRRPPSSPRWTRAAGLPPTAPEAVDPFDVDAEIPIEIAAAPDDAAGVPVEPAAPPEGLPPAPDDPSTPFWYHQPSEPGSGRGNSTTGGRTWTASTTAHGGSGEPVEVAYRTHQILVFAALTGVVVGLVTVVLKKARSTGWRTRWPTSRSGCGRPDRRSAWSWPGPRSARSPTGARRPPTDEYIRSFHTDAADPRPRRLCSAGASPASARSATAVPSAPRARRSTWVR